MDKKEQILKEFIEELENDKLEISKFEGDDIKIELKSNDLIISPSLWDDKYLDYYNKIFEIISKKLNNFYVSLQNKERMIFRESSGSGIISPTISYTGIYPWNQKFSKKYFIHKIEYVKNKLKLNEHKFLNYYIEKYIPSRLDKIIILENIIEGDPKLLISTEPFDLLAKEVFDNFPLETEYKGEKIKYIEIYHTDWFYFTKDKNNKNHILFGATKLSKTKSKKIINYISYILKNFEDFNIYFHDDPGKNIQQMTKITNNELIVNSKTNHTIIKNILENEKKLKIKNIKISIC